MGKGLSQYQQIGNAVPPLMAFEIASTLKRILKKGNDEVPGGENKFLNFCEPESTYND